jgi:LytS/YehU family sensor histidine kinase
MGRLLRAQVDPAFVFQTLEMIEQTYETIASRADVLLDELVAFLRAAIPRLRAEEVLGSSK